MRYTGISPLNEWSDIIIYRYDVRQGTNEHVWQQRRLNPYAYHYI